MSYIIVVSPRWANPVSYITIISPRGDNAICFISLLSLPDMSNSLLFHDLTVVAPYFSGFHQEYWNLVLLNSKVRNKFFGPAAKFYGTAETYYEYYRFITCNYISLDP